jgi:ADP-heptose:LPS heptosyltransferase
MSATRYTFPEAGEKLLLIKYSALGDVINVTSVLSCLRHHFPELQISWLLCSEYEPLMRNTQDYVDNIISWDRKKGMSEFFKVIQTIRQERFDWLLDIQ